MPAQQASQVGRQAGRQATQDAIDLGFDIGMEEGTDTEARIHDEYVSGVQNLQGLVQEGLAKGIDVTRPDISNPDSIAAARAFRDEFARVYEMAENLKTSRDVREKRSELRFKQGIYGRPMASGDLQTYGGMEQSLVQSQPFDEIVQEFNKGTNLFNTQSPANQYSENRQQAEEAINNLERQMLAQGEDPELVRQIADASRAKLRRPVVAPKVFAPTGGGDGGSGDGSKTKVAGRRALIFELSGARGVKQAMHRALGMQGQRFEYNGRGFKVENAHFKQLQNSNAIVLNGKVWGRDSVEDVISKGLDGGDPIQPEELNNMRERRRNNRIKRAEEWLAENPQAGYDYQDEEIMFKFPATDDENAIISSAGAQQFTAFYNSALPVSDQVAFEEARMASTPTGVSLPDDFPGDEPEPDEQGVIIGQPSGKVIGEWPNMDSPDGSMKGTGYQTEDGKLYFVPYGQ